MINALIALGLFIVGCKNGDPLLLIAAGVFSVAAEISHYRFERKEEEDFKDEI